MGPSRGETRLEVRALGLSRGWRVGLWAPVGAGGWGFGPRSGLARGIEGFAVIKGAWLGFDKVDWFRLVDLLSTAPGFGVLGPKPFRFGLQ